MGPGKTLYAEAVLPKPYTILGVKLKPFCIGHYFHMQKEGCSIVDNLASLSMSDLLLALFVCHHSYEDFRDVMDGYRIFYPFGYRIKIKGRMVWNKSKTRKIPKHFKKFCERWSKALAKHRKQNPDFRLIEHINKFLDYVNAGSATPDYTVNVESDGQSGGHPLQAIIMTLVSDCGYTMSEAFNFPLVRCNADFAKHLERNGAVTFWTDEQIEQFKQLNQLGDAKR
jgi:hypothetical protein